MKPAYIRFVELTLNYNQDNPEFSPILIDDSALVFVMPAATFVSVDEPVAGLTDYVVFSKRGLHAQLENRCSVLACRVNDAEITFGDTASAQPGDIIQIGLVTLTARADVTTDDEAVLESQAGQAESASSIQLEDLGTAIDPLFTENLPDESTAPAAADPNDFSDLIALAGTLGQIDHYHDHPEVGDPLSILDGAPGALPPGHGLFDEGNEADPLTQLSEEYRQTMLHGGRDVPRELKDHRLDNPRLRAPEDPFLDAPERFAQGSLLDDLLGQRQNIDTVLKELDSFGADLLFARDERQEVLTLVAPPGLAAQHASAPSAQLARREHHLMSVDSPFPLAATTTTPQEPAHDPLA